MGKHKCTNKKLSTKRRKLCKARLRKAKSINSPAPEPGSISSQVQPCGRKEDLSSELCSSNLDLPPFLDTSSSCVSSIGNFCADRIESSNSPRDNKRSQLPNILESERKRQAQSSLLARYQEYMFHKKRLEQIKNLKNFG